MIIPCLTTHLYGNSQCHYSNNCGNQHIFFLQLAVQQVDESCNTHTTPDGKSIERTRISIVAFTYLLRILIKVDDNSQTCHEEQEEHNPELADAHWFYIFFVATGHTTFASVPRLPEESDKTEHQWHHIEYIVAFVVFQLIGQCRLVSQTPVVQPTETTYPVAMFQFALTLNIILTACEIPHEIAPIHEIALV